MLAYFSNLFSDEARNYFELIFLYAKVKFGIHEKIMPVFASLVITFSSDRMNRLIGITLFFFYYCGLVAAFSSIML